MEKNIIFITIFIFALNPSLGTETFALNIVAKNTALKADTATTLANTIAEEGNIVSKTILILKTKELRNAMLASLGPYAAIALAIGAVVAAVALVVKEYNKEQKAVEETTAEVQHLSEFYDKARESNEKLKESLNNYETAVKNI